MDYKNRPTWSRDVKVWRDYSILSSQFPHMLTRIIIPMWHQNSSLNTLIQKSLHQSILTILNPTFHLKNQQRNIIFPRGHAVIAPTAYHNRASRPPAQPGGCDRNQRGFPWFLNQQLQHLLTYLSRHLHLKPALLTGIGLQKSRSEGLNVFKDKVGLPWRATATNIKTAVQN